MVRVVSEIDFEDPRLRRIVRNAARRMARVAATRGRSIDIEDLIQEGYIGLLVTRRPFDLGECTWEAWVWHRAREKMRDLLALRANRADSRPIPRDMPSPDRPEPTDEMVRSFAPLSDREATAVTLACGLDGPGHRSLSDVAWMTRRHTANVCREYRRGLAKIRGALPC